MKKLGSEALLLLTSAIWGLAFVAQRQGMQYLDPLLFNGIRFALGAFVVGFFAFTPWFKKLRNDYASFTKRSYTLVEPFSKRLRDGNLESSVSLSAPFTKRSYDMTMPFPWLLGSVLFIASTLQQTGIVYTTAGSAGFITGLYVVFVPLIGLWRRQKLSPMIIIAVLLSVAGLYLINVKQPLSASLGNLLVLISAVFWAWHVQMIDHYAKKYDAFSIAFNQFSFVALASLGSGVIYQLTVNPSYFSSGRFFLSVQQAILPILYGGLCSVGIAYTLQVIAQKKVPPAPAAIILCLEGVFALLGGWLLLQEALTPTILAGAALLLVAMLLSISKSTH